MKTLINMEFRIEEQEGRESLMREIMTSGIKDCAKENQHYLDLIEITELKQMTTVELLKSSKEVSCQGFLWNTFEVISQNNDPKLDASIIWSSIILKKEKMISQSNLRWVQAMWEHFQENSSQTRRLEIRVTNAI